MPGRKTSVWLSEEQVAWWKASGLSLTEIFERGRMAPDTGEASAAAIRAAIGEEIAGAETRSDNRIRRIVREELERIASR